MTGSRSELRAPRSETRRKEVSRCCLNQMVETVRRFLSQHLRGEVRLEKSNEQDVPKTVREYGSYIHCTEGTDQQSPS